MKKIRRLQILVYITFTLFFLQNYAPAIYRGFIQGFNDYDNVNDGAPSGHEMITLLDAGLIPGVKNDSLKVGTNYLLHDINVSAAVRLTNANIGTPEWIKTIKVLSTMLIVMLLGNTANFINKVIIAIYEGNMFGAACIKLIRKIGVCIIAYTIIDYLYQWADFLKQSALIHAPLKIINTVEFSFGTVLCAIFVFIIAEAFKQGGKLKAEQELTI
jgi:hypothetical protein